MLTDPTMFGCSSSFACRARETIEIVSPAVGPPAIVGVVVPMVVIFPAVVVLVFAAQNGDGWNALDVVELVVVLFAATNSNESNTSWCSGGNSPAVVSGDA